VLRIQGGSAAGAANAQTLHAGLPGAAGTTAATRSGFMTSVAPTP